MFDTVQTIARNLAQPDPVSILALRILSGLALGAAAAILLTCGGFVLAHCCRGEQKAPGQAS